MNGKRILIIGGGISGLASAFRITEAAERAGTSVTITLMEAGPRLGGAIRSERRDGWLLEAGPDSMIRTKPAGMRLLEDLGLAEHAVATKPEARRSLIAKGNRLLPVPQGLYLLAPGRILPFLVSPLVSWAGKLRMGLDLLLPRRRSGADEESLADFVRRRLGEEALVRIAQPMVGGIYTADPERLSLEHTFPLFVDMERQHRSLIIGMRKRAREQAAAQRSTDGSPDSGEQASGPRYGLFCSLPEGWQQLVDVLTRRCEEAGVRIRTNAPVRSCTRDEQTWRVAIADEEPHTFDEVICTGPAHIAAGLLTEAAPELAAELAAVPYASCATVNLGWHQDDIPPLPQAAGFVVPAVEARVCIACTLMSNKYPDRAPPDHVLLRAFAGGALHDQVLERSDDALVAGLLEDLRDLLGITASPRLVQVNRWNQAMAQPIIGHRDRLQRIRNLERSTPGLHLVGNGFEGVGIPDLAQQAENVSQGVLES